MNLTTIDIDLAKSHSSHADIDQHKNDDVAGIAFLPPYYLWGPGRSYSNLSKK